MGKRKIPQISRWVYTYMCVPVMEVHFSFSLQRLYLPVVESNLEHLQHGVMNIHEKTGHFYIPCSMNSRTDTCDRGG